MNSDSEGMFEINEPNLFILMFCSISRGKSISPLVAEKFGFGGLILNPDRKSDGFVYWFNFQVIDFVYLQSANAIFWDPNRGYIKNPIAFKTRDPRNSYSNCFLGTRLVKFEYK